jgi:hypothetical protein
VLRPVWWVVSLAVLSQERLGGRRTPSGSVGAAIVKEKELKTRRKKVKSFMVPILFGNEKAAKWSLAGVALFS